MILGVAFVEGTFFVTLVLWPYYQIDASILEKEVSNLGRKVSIQRLLLDLYLLIWPHLLWPWFLFSPFLVSFIGPVENVDPTKRQTNMLEYAYDFVVGFTKGNIGEHYMKDYSLFLFVLFLFLLVANNIGLMAKTRNNQRLQFVDFTDC